jgi:hypothetical protein
VRFIFWHLRLSAGI